MSVLYFIAGASGSGKTAMMKDLQEILGNSRNGRNMCLKKVVGMGWILVRGIN